MSKQVLLEDLPLRPFHVGIAFRGTGGQFSDGFVLGIIGIAVSMAAGPLHLDALWMGLLGAASLAGLFFGSMLAGPVADKYGRRTIFAYDMLLFAVVSAAQYFVTTPSQLLVLRLVLGLFGGYAALTERLAEELVAVRDKLRTLPLGGTAIGTGFGAPAGYRAAVYAHLQRVTGVDYRAPADPFDAMQNMDVFSRVSAELRTCAVSLAKIASDLTVLSSGPVGGLGELKLPEAQAGSSIMPGKVNPVLPMAMIQLSFAVVGNDVAVAQAVQYGELEINHFEPVVASRVFDSIALLTNGIRRFGEKCVKGIEADVACNEKHLMESMAVATALVPRIGYARVSKLARQSVAEGRSMVAILDESGLLSPDETIAAIRKASYPVFDA